MLTYKNLNNYIGEVGSIAKSNRMLKTLEVVLSKMKDAETGQRGLARDTRNRCAITERKFAVSMFSTPPWTQ